MNGRQNGMLVGLFVTVVGGIITAWLIGVFALGAHAHQQPAPDSLGETTAPVPAGTYLGTYLCPQGWTGVRLTVSEAAGGSQRGRFEFGGDGLPNGSYAVEIRPEGGRQFLLQPLHWELQPPDYDMVAVWVELNGNSLTGQVEHPDCGEFSATLSNGGQ